MENPQPPRYSYQVLANLILAYEDFTGERPSELLVTPNFYTWFIQECAKDADMVNKNRGWEVKLPDEPQYMNVLIKKKVKIIK